MNRNDLTIGIYLAGHTYHNIKLDYGDFEDWFSRELEKNGAKVRIFDVREGEYMKDEPVDGLVITGSSSSVCTDPADWVAPLLTNLTQLMERNLPMLGVCFGHQALAAASGGVVEKHPRRRELGTTELFLTPDGRNSQILQGLNSPFYAQETHEDVVTEIPEDRGYKILAENEHNRFQSIQYSDVIYSTQFHPEISAAVMKEYIKVYAERSDDTENIGTILENVRESSTGAIVMENFVNIVNGSVQNS
jgi:GMP synthase (glutamine-hydrolysing)